jgi:hypothetical protein
VLPSLDRWLLRILDADSIDQTLDQLAAAQPATDLDTIADDKIIDDCDRKVGIVAGHRLEPVVARVSVGRWAFAVVDVVRSPGTRSSSGWRTVVGCRPDVGAEAVPQR